jgi:hypothetical protein
MTIIYMLVQKPQKTFTFSDAVHVILKRKETVNGEAHFVQP